MHLPLAKLALIFTESLMRLRSLMNPSSFQESEQVLFCCRLKTGVLYKKLCTGGAWYARIHQGRYG